MKSILKKIVVAVLTAEAKLLLKRTKPQIIAVTGSVGKTSVKDAIYAVLKDSVYTRKSEKSYNSEIGVPLSVLGLKNAWNSPVRWLKNIIDGFMVAVHPGSYPKLLVLEMGVDRPGDMARLAEWIHPDIVVLTRFPDVPVHVEYFETPEAVIEEKKKLVEALKPDGILVYNRDDARVTEVADAIPQQSIGYSKNTLSPFTASHEQIVYEDGQAVGFEFTLTHLEEACVVRVEGTLGAQHAYNYAAAIAVGSVFEIGIEIAAERLRMHTPPPGRMRLLRGKNDSLILDDSYNASPIAMERALMTLKEVKGIRRRVAVLGDMMELGRYSVREHEKVGELAATAADALITIGVRSQKIASSALEHGMNHDAVLACDNAEDAAEELNEILRAGDLVLIKGSQSIRTERVVEAVMAEPERASELLVRQSAIWKSI